MPAEIVGYHPAVQPRTLRRRSSRPVDLIALLALAAALVAACGAPAGAQAPAQAGQPDEASSPLAGASVMALAEPEASATETSPSPAPSVAALSPSPEVADVLIVPVTHFRSALDGVGWRELEATLAGTSKVFAGLELVASDADAILAALGVERPPAGSDRLILATSAGALAGDLARNRDRLAFLRADQVGPSVRALAWGKTRLFGVDRVRTVDAWPLRASLPAARPDGFEPANTWTVVAGGDILLDRGVHLATRVEGRGIDFPFDGAFADITSRYCCSSFGWVLPKAKRIGEAGAVRDLLQGADLAIANFENPAPDSWTFHKRGTVFHAEPAKIEGLVDAGLDWVSLANNHIGDAGDRGILQTRANLTEHGLAFGGAGKNASEARRPSLLEAAGQTVAILAYDTIAPPYWATSTQVGSARMTAAAVEADVAKARKAGADVVIVFPHWGVEYKATASSTQRALARAAIDAGADMVIGGHSHWAGAMEVYEGKPIWYSLGNFVFDQTWSEQTMEGLLLELTFAGRELVQARLRPHLILDRAQPNLLDPRGDGRVVLERVWEGSGKGLPW
jgi:poly-gamma-glutamate synthesis protein (capsule biosynthesis protein)